MRMGTNWDRHYSEPCRRWLSMLGLKGNVVLNRNISKLIKKHTKKHNSYIELGAGSGRLAKKISNSFYECTILDFSEASLTLAHRIAKKCKPILADVLKFNTEEKFDAVVSVGLLEHFDDENMKRLVDKHISLTAPEGTTYICVPSYNIKREKLIVTREMIEKYGYQDAKAEFKIAVFIRELGYVFEKYYLDIIPEYNVAVRTLKKLNILTYRFFNINMEFLFKKDFGEYAMFIIKMT
jgi:SAM-dependent methyltransferase